MLNLKTRVVHETTLQLTDAELRFLWDLLACVGGCPVSSRRAIADSFLEAISAAFPSWEMVRAKDIDEPHSTVTFLPTDMK